MESNFIDISQENLSEADSDNALNLKFSIGYSSDILGAVQNITLNEKTEIFFPSANTGVIYNYETHEHKLLQGHCNQITASCVAYDSENKKRLIVTADSEKDSMIVVWDADTATPLKTIFSKTPPYEIVSIDISPNCNYIATLSTERKDKIAVNQFITIWNWHRAEEIILSKIELKELLEEFKLIRFNPSDEECDIELLVSGNNKILFWIIDQNATNNCRSYFPLGNEINKKEIVKSDNKNSTSNKNTIADNKANKYTFTQSTFIKKSSMVITGTTDGRLIVWDKCPALCKENENINDRRKIKEVQLFNNNGNPNNIRARINFLINYDEYIVVGSGDGGIKFYDSKFIITRWFDNVSWTVTSISFDFADPSEVENEDYEEDVDKSKNFKCLPFIISDVSASIKRVYKQIPERDKFLGGFKKKEIDHEDKDIKVEEIYRGMESNISSISLHPRENIIAVGVKSNKPIRDNKQKDNKSKEPIIPEKKFELRPYVQLFNYPDHMKAIKQEFKKEEEWNQKKKFYKKSDDKRVDDNVYLNPCKRFMDANPISIEYSPDGRYIIVGADDDVIYILNPDNLQELLPPKDLKIKDVADDENNNEIKEIVFGPMENDESKMFAAIDNGGRIGLFKFITNANNSETEQWTLMAREKFDHEIISFCFSEKGDRIYAICKDKYLYEFNTEPSHGLYFNGSVLPINRKLKVEHDSYNMTSIIPYPVITGKDRNVLITNDDFKMRLVMTHIPLNNDLVIKKTTLGPSYGGHIKRLRLVNEKILAFSTEEKIFGLIYIDNGIDGNPFRVMGVIGHPSAIVDLRICQHYDYIITAGKNTINGWRFYENPLVENYNKGGKDLQPFLSLIEGGGQGLVFQDMNNLFYYAQIYSRDENTTKQRTLKGDVHVKNIHGLLAALGYYPSREDLDNIYNEVKYSKYSDTNEKINFETVNFENYVKIYINHRPYKELEMDRILKAFNNIKMSQTNTKGLEHGISRDYLVNLLKEHGDKDKMDEKELSDCLKVLVGDNNIKSLPEVITFEYLFYKILKFEPVEEDIEDNK